MPSNMCRILILFSSYHQKLQDILFVKYHAKFQCIRNLKFSSYISLRQQCQIFVCCKPSSNIWNCGTDSWLSLPFQVWCCFLPQLPSSSFRRACKILYHHIVPFQTSKNMLSLCPYQYLDKQKSSRPPMMICFFC